MKASHGKGLCDPIGWNSKAKADLAAKNDKAIIQAAHDFYKWRKKTKETSSIEFAFLSTQEYENTASFLRHNAEKGIHKILLKNLLAWGR